MCGACENNEKSAELRATDQKDKKGHSTPIIWAGEEKKN